MADAPRKDGPPPRRLTGAPSSRPQAGAILWARAMGRRELGRRFVAPQVAAFKITHHRPEYGSR
eukprot:1394855-Alexandrium_andersonii.AAC.1